MTVGETKSPEEIRNAADTLLSAGVKVTPPIQNAQAAASECPSKHRDPQIPAAEGCPVKHGPPQPSAAGDGCPVKGTAAYKHPVQYNVYGQVIDPKNQMPATPAQELAPGQRVPLPTDRVRSNIPKAGTDETWTYPSPQMFWNSLARKGKLEGAAEEDMGLVVAIHNNMNENTWHRILQWEQLDGDPKAPPVPGSEPRLLRFLGRPHDISPKAWFKSSLGHPQPFDRHDWVVDRGGRERRYVIDYYHDESRSHLDKVPDLSSKDDVKSIGVDVRPAVDSPWDAWDRWVRMPVYRRLGKTDFTPLPFLPSDFPNFRRAAAAGPETGGGRPMDVAQKVERGETLRVPDAMAVAELTRAMHDKCQGRLQAVRDCKGEQDCERAAVALTYCMAQLACKKQAAAFDRATQLDQGDIEGPFKAMQDCLAKLEARDSRLNARQA